MITKVLLPQLELTMESVTVVGLLAKEGTKVAAEQGLIEVETQKATSEVPAPVAGYVRGLAVKAGDVIGEKALICFLSTTADEPLTVETVAAPVAAAGAKISPAGETKSAEPIVAGVVKAVPAARRIAKERGVDLAHVKPTGAGGMVTVQDVESYAASQGGPAGKKSATEGSHAGVESGWEEIAPARMALNAQMQKSLAEIPQIVVTRHLDVTALSKKEEGITFTHKLIAKLGAALASHPALRTATDGKRTKVLPVSVAVAIDTPAGLIAPVLRTAELDSLQTIASRVADWRDRAAQRTIKNEELKDGPFALTNLGMLGVDLFTPFVFYGQTAVLAIGKTTDGANGTKLAWCSVAVDHRVVDGAEAARFLATLQEKISA